MNDIINTFLSVLSDKWVNIIWILVLFFLGKIILRWIVGKAKRFADDGDDERRSIKEKQADTLGSMILTTGNVVIYLIILLMLLGLFNVDITPILAGAGIIGLAVGFGAQTLVKDFVSGLFIFLEHQYHVGDNIKIGDFEGKVVKISMRSTVIQNEEGKTFYISNGTVNKVINSSQKDYKWEQ